MERIHATCIVVDGHGVLLRGSSGSGKSDLALRLIFAGASLVADDRVDLVARDGRLHATAPEAIAGLLEVRGIGVVALGSEDETVISLAVDLITADEVERMPEESMCEFLGIPIRRIALTPFEASTVAKVFLAVRLATGTLVMAP